MQCHPEAQIDAKVETVNLKFIVIHRYGVLDRVLSLDPYESVIGRRRGCTIFLDDIHVSRKHAAFTIDDDRLSIVDFGSANGTFLNGQPVDREAEVHEGDEVCIGPFMLKVCGSIPQGSRNQDDIEYSTLIPMNGLHRVQPMVQQLPVLTFAQQRVLNALLEGGKERDIAERLDISHHTVHTHAKAIYKTYQVSSRAELVARYLFLTKKNSTNSVVELDTE